MLGAFLPFLTTKSEVQDSGNAPAADLYTAFKHVLLPITDRNPTYPKEQDRFYFSLSSHSSATLIMINSAAATTAALAKKYGADITVVVIDDKPKESIPEHDAQLSSIRWHLSEAAGGGSKKPTAIIGELADDLNLDLVVLSMEAIHSKHVDGNLLAEFVPCPVLLLPL
ncbi:unnamed protein product [Spirodela intermedia]|uniref:Uncharacterized protein n=1 Tax=Spirodela intermedia TaxID=51605 RepID=A0A7I8J9Q4_SPIIN|nr:unnamed protein product [Spirodela intermedia]CAA6666711.1 unnamed protein product [Spirodela intermedia]